MEKKIIPIGCYKKNSTNVDYIIGWDGMKRFSVIILATTISWALHAQVYTINPSRNINYQVQLKEIKFSNGKCSYYVPTNARDILVNNINQQRVNMMKNMFNGYISDDSQGWTLAKQNIEKTCNKNEDRLDDCFYNLDAGHYYQNANVISITYWYSFYKGGAHGGSGEITHTFNKSTGGIISMKQLIRDYNRFIQIAEKCFRKTYNLTSTNSLNDGDGGFMFDNNQFKISNKFEFTDKGIRFYYDDYEVSCYSCGRPEFTISYSELKGIINDEYLPNSTIPLYYTLKYNAIEMLDANTQKSLRIERSLTEILINLEKKVVIINLEGNTQSLIVDSYTDDDESVFINIKNDSIYNSDKCTFVVEKKGDYVILKITNKNSMVFLNI